jgi:hypothetical protein
VSKLLAVAARELRERWLLFPGALVSGCFPLVLPAFGIKREYLPTVGIVGAILLGLAAAVVVGSSMLARDAANGRLAFLFSRPVPWPAIWGGKWLAALVLVASTGLLNVVPWMATIPLASVGGHHGDSWIRAMLDGPGSVFVFILIVLAVGLANFNATLFRSRSPWLALDLLLLLAAIWAVRQYVAPLWLYGVLGWSDWNVLALSPLALAFLVGSLAQVAVGRTDLRRGHRALSLGFWSVMALTLASAAGYWHWVRSVTPAEVSAFAVTRDPSGRWAYVEGRAARSGWYPHGFLIDTATGRHLVLGGPDEGVEHSRPGMLFSADGRFGALPGVDRDGRGAALRLFDLTGDTPRLTTVTLESSPPPTWGTAFALSPSAASAFMVHESGASLFALPSGRRLATTTIPPGWRGDAVRFLAEGRARVWLVPWTEVPGARRARAEMRVVDLAADGQSRAVNFPVAASLNNPQGWGAVVPDADGRRIVTADAGLHLRDGGTGELLATLVEGSGSFQVLFLADGRIVGSDGQVRPDEPGPPRVLVRVFDGSGAPLREMRLDLVPGGLRLGPEVAPGRVAVSSFRAFFLPEDTLLVDVGEGRVVDRLAGLRPKFGFWDVSSAAPAGGGLASVHFFGDDQGRVIRIDFATGGRRVVAGPGAAVGERLSVR